MIEELDMVALTRDIDTHGLKRGDIGAVISTANRPLKLSLWPQKVRRYLFSRFRRLIYDLCKEEKFCMPGSYRMLPMPNLHVSSLAFLAFNFFSLSVLG